MSFKRDMSKPEISAAAAPSGPSTVLPAPRHVAIIMDGNGRWAARRGLPRVEGHRRGVEAVRRAVRSALDLGVRYLTVYSFSSENWRRPAQEVSDLMGLLKRFIRNDLADLHASNVQVRIIGDRQSLAPDIRALLNEAEDVTRHNDRLTLVVAFNYGGRQEIVRAVQALARRAQAGALDPDRIDAAMIGAALEPAASRTRTSSSAPRASSGCRTSSP